jgi:uncharacterized membrane protein YcaP (DUF421 family)
MNFLQLLERLMGLSLRPEQLDFGQMAVRAALMYLLLLIIVRGGKKRFMGRATAFDFILVIMIGSIAARALTGGAPFFPALLGIAILVFIHWLFSLIAQRSPAFSGLIKGHSTLLVKDGNILKDAMADAHLSKDDLDEDLRQQGVGDVSDVKEARLERSGQVSVLTQKNK